jgi:DNA-binding response OmpR family regulator
MNPKVLIVEDDETTRKGLTELLMTAGYMPLAASSFPEGMQLLDSQRPDLLIVDVRLGEYNGLQLVIASERRVPAIVLTGHADPVLAEDARDEGAEYLVKPVEPAALLALISQRLAGHRDSRPHTT